MTSELVVDVQPKEVSIALLEDKQLVELQSEGRNISFSVGNMYLGRVKKLMPGLNACFVDVGYEKDAFLHYLDLGPQFNSLEKYVKQTLSDKKKLNPITKATILPDLEKDGTVSNTLKVGQEVVVQIVKEPISTKGPRLTSELSFAGRYLVLIPFNDKVSVSQKIKSSEERARLKQLLMSIKPKNFGVIVRTVAEGKRVAELDGELKVLLKHWEDAITKVQKATKFPTLIYEETSRAVGLLRDLFNPSFENIHVNNEAVYHEIKDYVTLIAPERAGIVKLYKGQLPIYDNFGITKQIKSSFGKTISYKSGAYLIIEHTEALHVVDVNSGNRTKNANGQEANALEVNLGAADELARQLRLRDMADEWMHNMQNADGTTGPHWTFEQCKQVMQQHNMNCDPVEFWVAMNAVYSDFCKVNEKHGIRNIDYYVDAACAFWLEDKDAVKNKETAYYLYVVKH